MKKFFFVLLISATALFVNAQPPEGNANPGEWYGEQVSKDGALELRDVAAKLEGGSVFEGDTKIRAKIVEVCPKKGCWLKLEIDDKTTATVKMKDYGFFLPLAAKGKTVVIDGKVEMKTTSVAELKHYAEDAKKSKEEIDAITEPQKEVRVLAKGIVVVE
jgi:hypothetical protein